MTRRTSAEATSSTSARKWRSSAAARGRTISGRTGSRHPAPCHRPRTMPSARGPTRGRGARRRGLCRRVLTRISRRLKPATSTPVASRPDSSDCTSVVPEPANGSSTCPPGTTYRSRAPRRAAERTCRGRDVAGGRASCAHARGLDSDRQGVVDLPAVQRLLGRGHVLVFHARAPAPLVSSWPRTVRQRCGESPQALSTGADGGRAARGGGRRDKGGGGGI